MYETPKLQLVGKARDVILGSCGLGFDLDGSNFVPNLPFGDDPDPEWSE
jgi:hypothetical protein